MFIINIATCLCKIFYINDLHSRHRNFLPRYSLIKKKLLTLQSKRRRNNRKIVFYLICITLRLSLGCIKSNFWLQSICFSSCLNFLRSKYDITQLAGIQNIEVKSTTATGIKTLQLITV